MTADGLCGVGEDDLDTKTRQRKPGSSAGTPRRSCQAKISHISPRVKLREARRRGGWGRLSDDAPGQYNPDPSEGPWGRAGDSSKGGATKSKDQPTGWASWSRMRKSRQQELVPIAALRQGRHQIQQALNRLRSLSTFYLQGAMRTQSRNVQWTLSGRQKSQNGSLAHPLPKPLLLPLCKHNCT